MEKMKVYTLLYMEDSDDRCDSEVEAFTDIQAARAAMKQQYSQKLSDLCFGELDDGYSAPIICDDYAGISANKDFDHYSWEITTHEIEVPPLRVKTPLGTLIAKDTRNSDYPGICIDLECDYGDEKGEQIGIANVEYGESLNDKREICIAAYEDMDIDDCTHYLRVDSHGKINK